MVLMDDVRYTMRGRIFGIMRTHFDIVRDTGDVQRVTSSTFSALLQRYGTPYLGGIM